LNNKDIKISSELNILHLSDFHIGYSNLYYKAVKIINNIIKKQNPKNTIIIITGDLIESFSEKNIKKAQALIEKLK
jgi:predicted MPP superfamily phosphohydrolase